MQELQILAGRVSSGTGTGAGPGSTSHKASHPEKTHLVSLPVEVWVAIGVTDNPHHIVAIGSHHAATDRHTHCHPYGGARGERGGVTSPLPSQERDAQGVTGLLSCRSVSWSGEPPLYVYEIAIGTNM